MAEFVRRDCRKPVAGQFVDGVRHPCLRGTHTPLAVAVADQTLRTQALDAEHEPERCSAYRISCSCSESYCITQYYYTKSVVRGCLCVCIGVCCVRVCQDLPKTPAATSLSASKFSVPGQMWAGHACWRHTTAALRGRCFGFDTGKHLQCNQTGRTA